MSDEGVAGPAEAAARKANALVVLRDLGAQCIEAGPQVGWWYFRATRAIGTYGRGVVVMVGPCVYSARTSWAVQVMDSREWEELAGSEFPSLESACEWLWHNIGGDSGMRFARECDAGALERLLHRLTWRTSGQERDDARDAAINAEHEAALALDAVVTVREIMRGAC